MLPININYGSGFLNFGEICEIAAVFGKNALIAFKFIVCEQKVNPLKKKKKN